MEVTSPLNLVSVGVGSTFTFAIPTCDELPDIMMPKMTGYEVCRIIRDLKLMNDLPVIMLTAKTQVSDLVEGFDSGANDYLTKPISKGELLTRVKTHLNLANINLASSRFVPADLLRLLKKDSIVDLNLGDQTQAAMTILFQRDFAVAAMQFDQVVRANPNDTAAILYREKSADLLVHGVPADWEGSVAT